MTAAPTRASAPPASRDFDWIDDNDSFDVLLDKLVGEPRYAIDTEFHRERTYYPRLALVQVGWSDGIALIDPLTIDPRRFRRLFETDAVAVVHAAQQDLDVLSHAVGAIPRRIFDTQLAANFVGYSTPSLLVLVKGELRQSPPKGDRLTDWLERPLTAQQLAYAASDVEHLLELQDRIEAQLDELGRMRWVAEACEELRTRSYGSSDPDDAWLRVKEVRTLRPRSRAIARAVAAWREREARSIDTPVRQVLPDLGIIGVSQRPPATVDDLRRCRGLDERHRRGRIATELLAAVAAGLDAEPPTSAPSGDDIDRSLRPAVTLVSAWVSQVAKDARIETSMLATRADIAALINGDESARLRHGWRASLIGDGIARLLSGAAGLTFDGSGGLRLIDVARPASEPDAGPADAAQWSTMPHADGVRR